MLGRRDLAVRFPGNCATIFSCSERHKHTHHVIESRNTRVRDFSVSSPNFVTDFAFSPELLGFLLETTSSEDMVNFAVPQGLNFNYTCSIMPLFEEVSCTNGNLRFYGW